MRDATSGYRAYRADALRAIDVAGLRACGYGTQVELAWRVARSGRRLVELAICFHDRRWGESKMSGAIVAEAAWLVARLGLDACLGALDWRAPLGRRHAAHEDDVWHLDGPLTTVQAAAVPSCPSSDELMPVPVVSRSDGSGWPIEHQRDLDGGIPHPSVVGDDGR